MTHSIRRSHALVLLLLVPWLMGASAPVFLATPQLGVAQFIQGTDAALTYKAVYTGATNGSRCVSVVATNADSAAHVVRLRITRGATSYVLGAVDVGALAGINGIEPQANLLSTILLPGMPRESDGNSWVTLKQNDILQATYVTAFSGTTGEIINVFAHCADY